MTPERALPSGIVAFVFSDIEGSTRLFRRLGDGYVPILERHNELLRKAWAAHGGVEVKNEGDGFFVAFPTADGALHACVEAQHLLAAEAWPRDVDLRVRMGVHAGLAYPRGDDYVALSVNQTARIESAAHGGQVLVSEQAMARLGTPEASMLRPLGSFGIRDFDEPVRLFQAVTGTEPEGGFPAVRAVPADGHNLYRPPTTFVGRNEALRTLVALLAPGRVSTIVGPGGVGKTRLAIELGLRVAPEWGDGVWFVDLSPVEDVSLIPSAIASALGAAVRGEDDAWSAVLDHLRDRRALLILDTSEHLVEGVARRATELARSCPAVALLATSRVPLGAPGEHLFRLEPLGTAGEEGPSPAAELFVERAIAIDPSFEAGESTLEVVEGICRRVDGLPLAIELAAARVGVLSPQEILDGLEDRFRLLRSRDPTVPERQRTLDALIEWSDRILDQAQRRLLRRLGVFAGRFGLAEAGSVAPGGVGPLDAPDLVWALAESSLVTIERSAGATRYRLLDSVRAYAQRELEREGELGTTAERLGRWYVELFFDEGQFRRDRLADLQLTIDNLRGILPAVVARAHETAQWLACAIAEHSVLVTRFKAGAEELADIVAELTEPTRARVYLLVVFADLLLWSGDPDGAARTLDAAEELRAEVGTPGEGTDWSIAYDRADLVRRSGDLAATVEMVQRTLDTEPGDAGRSRMLNLLGVTKYELGDMEGAHAAFEEGLEVDRRVVHHQNVAIAHANLAETAVILDRREAAARHALESLRRSAELGMTATVGMAMFSAAHLAASDGQLRTGVRLAAAAATIQEATGFEPAAGEQGPTIETLFHRARDELGVDVFEEARVAGRELSLPDAITLADGVLTRLVDRPPS